MPRPARFAHVVLQSHNMPRLSRWYKDVFELDVIAQNPRAVIATYDDEHHRFAFTQLSTPAPSEPQVSPLKHVAYAYDRIDDLVAQYRKMKALGNTPKECVNHGPTLSFYYADPDGNGVEFFVDRFATMDETKAFMASPVFQKNLFGYHVNPEDIVAQFDAGVSPDEIMRYDQTKADAFLAKLH